MQLGVALGNIGRLWANIVTKLGMKWLVLVGTRRQDVCWSWRFQRLETVQWRIKDLLDGEGGNPKCRGANLLFWQLFPGNRPTPTSICNDTWPHARGFMKQFLQWKKKTFSKHSFHRNDAASTRDYKWIALQICTASHYIKFLIHFCTHFVSYEGGKQSYGTDFPNYSRVVAVWSFRMISERKQNWNPWSLIYSSILDVDPLKPFWNL